jgi:NNMT/PNMT/TEMT family
MKNENEREDNVHVINDDTGSLANGVAQQRIFRPRAYLAEFYEGDVGPANKALLRFYAKAYEDLGGRSLLEFGGGPTIYSLITAARTASWIHFCDYDADSLSEVNKWLIEDSSAFDWSCLIHYALSCENGGGETPSEEDVQSRQRLIRQRIRTLSRCDIFADEPLLGSSMEPYGAVAQTFCLDCLNYPTLDKREWFHLNQKLANLVDKDGLFISVSVLHGSYWIHQGIKRPTPTLTLADVTSMYAELGFSITHSEVVRGLGNEIDPGQAGYDGFIMTCGRRHS